MSFSSAVGASRIRKKLLLVGLAIVNISVLPVSAYVYTNPRPVVIGQYMYGLLFVLTFDILFMVFILSEDKPPGHGLLTGGSPQYRWQTLVSVTLIALSSLAIMGLTPIFFFIMSIILLLFLGRIITETGTRWSTMVLLSGVSLVLLLSILRVDGFPVGTNDVLVKGAYTEVVASTGDLAPLKSTRYGNMPIYFALGGITIQLVGLSPHVATILMGSILYTAALWMIYCIMRTLGTSSKVGLVAAVLVVTNPFFLQFSIAPRPQSLSFLLLCVFLYLYLLDIEPQRVRMTVLFILTTVVWIGTHHFSAMIVIPPILAYITYDVYRGVVRKDRSRLKAIGTRVLIWGSIASVYWILLTRLFLTPIRWVYLVSPGASGKDIVPTGTEDKVIAGRTAANDFMQLSTEAFPFFLQQIDYALLLGLTGVGVLLIITGHINFSGRLRVLIGLIVAGLIYFPNPLWLPVLSFVPIRRAGLLMIPFVIPIAAVAFVAISRRKKPGFGHTIGQATVSIIIVLLLLTSMLSGWGEPSVNDLAGNDKEARNYISNHDLQTIQFLRLYEQEGTTVYAPWLIQQYMTLNTGRIQQLEQSTGRFWRSDSIKPVKMDEETGRILYERGLTVYPQEALKQDPLKIQTRGNENVLVTESDTTWNIDGTSQVYDNGNSKVIYTV